MLPKLTASHEFDIGDVELAGSMMEVSICDGCEGVHITTFHEDGSLLSNLVVEPEEALEIARQITKAADYAMGVE